MGSTDFLLSVLILLVSAFCKIFYTQINTLIKEIKELVKSDVEQRKDIEQLKTDRDDHKARIIKLEILKHTSK